VVACQSALSCSLASGLSVTECSMRLGQGVSHFQLQLNELVKRMIKLSMHKFGFNHVQSRSRSKRESGRESRRQSLRRGYSQSYMSPTAVRNSARSILRFLWNKQESQALFYTLIVLTIVILKLILISRLARVLLKL
jgi:hypothetical protein